MRIIFQDIDGPLIPLRMYYSGGRPFNREAGSFVYDPVAVGMLNTLCQKYDAKVVFNTAHNENPHEIMRHQGTYNGIQYLHEDCKTKYIKEIHDRKEACVEWASRHKVEEKDWIVIDDLVVYKPRQVLIDYSYGMTINSFYDACKLFGDKVSPIIGIGQSNPNNYKV